MKRQIIILLITLLAQFSYAQNKAIQKDELLFEKGYLLQELLSEDLDLDDMIDSKDSSLIQRTKTEIAIDVREKILEKSLGYYQELIDSFPKSKLLFRALNNKGYIEIALEDDNEAEKTFLKIIDSKADDKETGGIGSGIMAEPYTNYKNRATKILANIYIKKKNFSEAIKYLDLAKKFPYRHFCGNAYAQDDIYMTELYAKCYIGLNDDKKALELLLPNILPNDLADNSELVGMAYKTLIKSYNKEDLKAKFEKSFKEYKTEKAKSNNEEYEKYFITFLDTKMVLNSWNFEFLSPKLKEESIQNIYKDSEFYKLLKK